MHAQVQNWINGEFQDPISQSWQDRVFLLEDHAYQVARSDAMDLIRAIQAANKAQVLWQKSDLASRQEILRKVAQALLSRKTELATLSALDQMLPLQTALSREVERAAAIFDYYGTFEATRPMSQPLRMHSPLGVVGILTAWSFPLLQLARDIAPALLRGNTLIVKPSSRTPQTPFLLARLLSEAGLPKGVCNFVFGEGSVIGQLMAAHPSIRALSFTGRTETAPSVLAASSPQLKKVGLQLSRKNAALILEDADWDKMLPVLARSCFEAAGQTPGSISRILVSEKVQSEFLDRFQSAVSQLKIGDPSDAETVVGPVAFESARARACAAVEEAVAEKGRLLALAAQPAPWMAPAIIADLHNCSPLQQEEIPGPVVLVVPYKAPHEGVKWINTTPFGACASIWSNDVERARKLAQNLDVATVWINSWDQFEPSHPAGGMKSSGLGRRGGEESLNFFSEIKIVYS